MSYLNVHTFVLNNAQLTFTADAAIYVDEYVDPETSEVFAEYSWLATVDGIFNNSASGNTGAIYVPEVFNISGVQRYHFLELHAENDFSAVSVDWRGDLQNRTEAEVGEFIAGYNNTAGAINVDIVFGTSFDDIIMLGQNADFADGGNGHDSIEGGTGNDTLRGNDGDDGLVGGPGADALDGGFGNDSYFLENGMDSVTDADGYDTISSTISRSLAGHAAIERLVLAGSADINGTGNGLNNAIYGNGGNNALNGGAGIDALHGGLGNDTFVLGGDADTLTDTGGYDTVSSTITRSIAGLAQIERLVLAGAADVNGTGNDLNNGLFGNTGNNALSGGNGLDTIAGGLGRDIYIGGAGNDIFDWNAVAETGTNASTRDAVTDFQQGGDKLDLATIDANGATAGDPPFAFRGTLAFNGAGQVRYFQVDNPAGVDFTIIEGNIDIDLATDFQIRLTGLYNLAGTDFNL